MRPALLLAGLSLAAGLGVVPPSLRAQALDGHWVAVFQKLDNGEDNTMYLSVQQSGRDLKGKFHTIGYGGDLNGTINAGHFTLYATWDKVKPFCTGEVVGSNLRIDLGYGKPFELHPQRTEEAPKAPAYLPPPALHKVPWNQLAKTPPMGWNSWNHFGGGVTDADVRSAADALVSSGMRDLGYVYVNIDDTWEGVRDAQGVLQPNHKFPDMKALAAYVHARGLKLGIYSSPGLRTCGGYPGSYGHEVLDAKTWAGWGIDYVKYDWCSAAEIYKDADLQAVYQRMGDALQASGRPMVYSLCEYGTNHVENWGADVGANLWRTTGDIRDEYASMMANVLSQEATAPAAGPGHWNDPDMLEVGNGKMTFDEYRTQMTLWSLLAAPLLAGNDLSKMSAQTLTLLTNKDMIAIDQDTLGRQARRVKQTGEVAVWVRPLADGGMAVGILNRSAAPTKFSLPRTEIGVPQSAPVRDVWAAAAVPASPDFQVNLAAHAAILLRVGPKP